MRRTLAIALFMVLALPAAADPGYICTGIGTVYEIPEHELVFYPDALAVAPTDCTPEVIYPEDVPVEADQPLPVDVDVPMTVDVDVPMPDDPTGFVLEDRPEFEPALQVRFGAR